MYYPPGFGDFFSAFTIPSQGLLLRSTPSAWCCLHRASPCARGDAQSDRRKANFPPTCLWVKSRQLRLVKNSGNFMSIWATAAFKLLQRGHRCPGGLLRLSSAYSQLQADLDKGHSPSTAWSVLLSPCCNCSRNTYETETQVLSHYTHISCIQVISISLTVTLLGSYIFNYLTLHMG